MLGISARSVDAFDFAQARITRTRCPAAAAKRHRRRRDQPLFTGFDKSVHLSKINPKSRLDFSDFLSTLSSTVAVRGSTRVATCSTTGTSTSSLAQGRIDGANGWRNQAQERRRRRRRQRRVIGRRLRRRRCLVVITHRSERTKREREVSRKEAKNERKQGM